MSAAVSSASGGRPGSVGVWRHCQRTRRRCQVSCVPGVTSRWRRRADGRCRARAQSKLLAHVRRTVRAEAGLPSRERSHGRRLQVGDDVQRSDGIPVPSSFSGIASNRAMGGLVHSMSGGSRLQAWQNKQLVIVVYEQGSVVGLADDPAPFQSAGSARSRSRPRPRTGMPAARGNRLTTVRQRRPRVQPTARLP